jgi:hypothetical protein
MLSQDQNLLLSGLSQESQYLLASHSVAVSLPLQTVLYEANIAPRFAYFLRSGIASVVASMTRRRNRRSRDDRARGRCGSHSSARKLFRPDQLLYSIGGNSSKNSYAGLSSYLSIIGGDTATIGSGRACWTLRKSI